MSKFRNYDNYEIYADGRIWSYKYKKFLKPQTTHNGYQRVQLFDNEGNGKNYMVHRVVWEAVTGEPIPENLEVNHISEDKTENFFENLELISHRQNINFGTCIERRAVAKSKQVGAFKDGKLSMKFNSIKEAHINGFAKSSVSRCCRNCFNREGNNVYKGYTWRYI